MKKQGILFGLIAVTAGLLVWARPHKSIPADLRDAVASGEAYDALSKHAEAEVPPAPAPQVTSKDGKSIYGSDDRLDYFEASAEMQKLSDSVVSLWGSRWVRPAGDKYNLFVVKFQNVRDLCPGERFADQPSGASCSGALVGEDLVMTAGHCIKDEASCQNTKFIFGFRLNKSGEFPETASKGEVYGCKRLVKQALTTTTPALIFHNLFNGGPGPDYALVQLDRKVPNHKPLGINRGKAVSAGNPLFILGHPMGLPLKVSGNAKVRDTSARYFFLSDLDSFAGNSGSAVFNGRTKLIEGILVRGDKDFLPTPAGCKVAVVQPQDAGKGESVTKISALADYIP